jgi:pilus assembly protein CpaF
MIPHDVHSHNIRSLLAPIAALLADPEVSEIMINGPSAIYAERRGAIVRTAHAFDSARALMSALRGVAQYVGRTVNEQQPILEARLPDGSRLEAVLPPAAPDGPIVSIRRMLQSTVTLDDLVAKGSVSDGGRSVLQALVDKHSNVLIAGGTGSGKTSVLGALCALLPPDERVVVIEDSRELSLRHDHVVQLEARPADARGHGEITVRQLFKATLRLRPDRIVVGEIRGAEAFELVQAMTSGHGGCLSTVHASSPLDALRRLETLALMSDLQLPLTALRAQVGSAIHAVVQTSRSPSGRRSITEIAAVAASERGYATQTLYREGAAAAPARLARRAP